MAQVAQKTFTHPTTGDELTIAAKTRGKVLAALRKLHRRGVDFVVPLDASGNMAGLSPYQLMEQESAIAAELLVDLKRSVDGQLKRVPQEERAEILDSSTALVKWVIERGDELAAEVEKAYEIDKGNS